MRKRVLCAFFCTICFLLPAGCAGQNKSQADGASAASEATETEEGSGSETEEEVRTVDTVTEETEAEETEAPGIDYEEIYTPVLSSIREMIQEGYDFEKDYDYGTTGIVERIMYPGDDDLMQVIGYVIEDINGDGIDELLIGENAVSDYNDSGSVSFVYSGYTCKEDKPVCFMEGWGRNTQSYMGNGHFYNAGSNGAASSVFGEWHLEPGGDSQTWDDFYFTEWDEENEEIMLFHNQSGSYDFEESERLNTTDDEFYTQMDNYKCVPIDWIPIERFRGTVQDAPAENLLPQEQLKIIENKLNGDSCYGFLLSYYHDPHDISWQEVFYDGAGMDQGYPSPEIEKAYLKEIGEEELMTDLTMIKGADIKEFVKSTTGFDYSEMNYPLDWVYLKDYDLYAYQHGDTNRVQVKAEEGYFQNGAYIITCDTGFDERCVVSFYDEGSTFRFVSNLPEWMVLDPTNGGDADQSMLTDGMLIPDSDSRKLTEEELKAYDAEQLRLARNEIYARHGRKFTDQKLQEYFNQMVWYAPVVEAADFDEGVLNEVERYNLTLIGKMEKAASKGMRN